MKKSDKEQWQNLFSYVEKEILDYDDNQKLQKNAVLRLRGLSQGQVIANSKCEKHGSYSPEVILTAFKINKIKIKDAMRQKEFSSEESRIAYCSAIVRNKLNDVYEHMQRAEHRKQQENNIDTSIMEHEGVEYRDQNTQKDSKKFPKNNYKELW